MLIRRAEMNLQLHFPDDAIERLREQAARNGQDLESFVQNLVMSRVSGLEALEIPPRIDPRDLWDAELKAFVESHPQCSHPADASRQTVYAERGN